MSRQQGGKVLDIFISSGKGEPMEQCGSVTALAGKGLRGDRYAEGKGAYSNSKRETIRHVTLIALEAIVLANKNLASNGFEAFKPVETRRNILTQDTELNGLVGVTFRVGEVALRGVELCTPCERPGKLMGKKGFNDAFQDHGGLRAEILTDGTIHAGDLIAEYSSDQENT